MLKGAKVQAAIPQQSPMAEFVVTLNAMARNRKMIAGAVEAISDWSLVLEDIEMMLHEGVIAGLRSRWVRRVAVPLFQAHRALQTDELPQVQATKALEILDQCIDEKIREVCRSWIRDHYGV